MTKTEIDKTHTVRIAFLGPECSGKSTLVQELAARLRAFTVPEYFRFYWEAKRFTQNHDVWTEAEFIHMAKEQNRFEDLYATQNSPLLLCDTTSLQVAVWHYRYLGHHSSRLLKLSKKRLHHLIFLCRPDIPFVQDGVRDGEYIREDMFSWLKDILTKEEQSFVILEGALEARLHRALHYINQLDQGIYAVGERSRGSK